jgi:sugar phosphate isomerase/epimerase
MQLGYSTWGMPNVPIDVSLKHLANLGFDAVEITVLPHFTTGLSKLDSSERKRIAHLLQEHKLALSAVGSYLNLMEQDPEQFAQHLAYVQSTIDLAVDWAQDGRLPVVISGFGGRPGDLATLQAQLVDRLNVLGEYAQARGVTVALEHHVGAAVETPDQTVGIMQQIESPAIRVNFDISHFNVVGIPIEESVTKMIPYTAHTHVKDERGRYPTYEYLIPGEGEFDYARYLKAMRAHGYTGCVSTEISVMVQRRPNYDPLAAATQSYQVLSRAFAEVGIERRKG